MTAIFRLDMYLNRLDVVDKAKNPLSMRKYVGKWKGGPATAATFVCALSATLAHSL